VLRILERLRMNGRPSRSTLALDEEGQAPTFEFTLSTDDKEWIYRAAKEEGTSAAAIVRRAIKRERRRTGRM
jgi:hypothetical protein